MKIFYSLLLCLSLCVFIACKENSSSNKEAEVTGNMIELPGLPKEQMIELWNKCEFIDYIFHELPFSLSQSETYAVQANLNFIGTEPAGKINLDCKALGREFFQIGGEIVLEADVYYSPDCYFYVFIKDEIPVFANKISEQGMSFYKQITTNINPGK